MPPIPPLQLIRRLFPSIASKDESALYKRLLDEVSARDQAITNKIQKMGMKATTPEEQQRVVASPQFLALEESQHPLKMARSNLLTATLAKPNQDDTARLLLATTPDEARHQASLIHRGTGYHPGDRGLPDNGVYIEGLSSEIPGGGTQMLKALEEQFPGAAMYLESVNNPATIEFYLKKGFMPQGDKSSSAIPRNLFVKPGDVKVRKAGGLVRMAKGGNKFGPLSRYAGKNLIPKRDVSVMDDYVDTSRVAPEKQEPGLEDGLLSALGMLPWGPGSIGKVLGALSALTASGDAEASILGRTLRFNGRPKAALAGPASELKEPFKTISNDMNRYIVGSRGEVIGGILPDGTMRVVPRLEPDTGIYQLLLDMRRANPEPKASGGPVAQQNYNFFAPYEEAAQ